MCVLAVGCGGGSKSPIAKYEGDMRDAVVKLAEANAAGAGFAEIQSEVEAAHLASDLAEKYRGVAKDLRKIDPPPDVADRHAELVTAVDGLATDYAKVASSRGRNLAAFEHATFRLEGLSRTFNAIQANGYDVGWK